MHVDADIATEPELTLKGLARPCPPASGACDRIRGHILSLFGCESVPGGVVFCIPAQSTETWVVCALHPETADLHAPIECRDEPASLLVARSHGLVRKSGTTYKKQTTRYRGHAERIAGGWLNVTTRCAEAQRFEAGISGALPP